MSKQFVPISLATIKGGVLQEVFERELASVLENIADANTKPKTSRKITLEVEFKPNESREMAEVILKAQSKLAPVEEVSTMIYLEQDKGRPVALEKVEDLGAIKLNQAGGY